MSSNTLVGLTLLLVAFADVAIGLLVLRPRLPEASRPVVLAAIGIGALLLLGLGVAFLGGWIPLGDPAG